MFCNCTLCKGQDVSNSCDCVQALLAALGLPCSLFQHLPASLQLMVVSLVAQLARYRHVSTQYLHIYTISTQYLLLSTRIYIQPGGGDRGQPE